MGNLESLCVEALKTTATSFRLGMEGQGSENLIKLIDLLTPLVQDSDSPHREQMNTVLAELFAAQSRKDYIYVADLLEYQLSKWLTGCERGNTSHGRQ